jgi:type IV pilus assembly protein PilE
MKNFMRKSLQSNTQRKKANGFTLIELVIAIAIVGILAAIAIPSYQDSVRKSKRKAAAACSVELAQFAERYYTTTGNLSYTGLAIPVGGLQCSNDLAAEYTFSYSAVAATSYTITAAALGDQANDGCGNLTLNNVGTKGQASGTIEKCWNK